eukprot:s266_g41.t1
MLHSLGELSQQTGDLKEGIKFLQESLKMQRSVHGDRDHPGIAATLQKLGDLSAQNGDLKEGIKFLQESLQMQRSLHGECDHPGIATTLHKLGDLTAQSGDLDRGIELLEESLQMQRSLHGDRAHPGMAVTLRKLGDVMALTGDVTQSMRHLLESAEVHCSLYGEKDHPNVADVLHSLGTANQLAGDLEQAEKFLEQSLRMKQSLFADKKHPSLRLTSNLLDHDRAHGTVYDIFRQIRADAECMTKANVASNPDIHTTWATACTRIMFASQKAAEILQRMIVIKGYFKVINSSALYLREVFEHEWADTAGANTAREFDFHSFILSEASLIRQLVKNILNIHGAQPGAPFEAQHARPIYSRSEVTEEIFFGGSTEICMRIADLAGFIVVGTHNDTFETACNEIIGETFAIEDLLLDFISATKGVRKSEQDSIIHTFCKIREIALECEAQVDEDGLYKETSDYDVDKVLLETISIRQLAQKILDQYRAPLGERLKELEEDKVSKVFGVIADASVEAMLLGGGKHGYWAEYMADYLTICREIIHVTHSLEGLVKPGLSASKMSLDEASTASFPETLEQLGLHMDERPRLWTCQNGANTILHAQSYDVCEQCFNSCSEH